MWLWIWIGLNIIPNLYGFRNGNFPGACDSMSPVHLLDGNPLPPQTSSAPFKVEYQLGQSIRDPVTVTLRSNSSNIFRGFMLQARVMSSFEEGPPVGKFITLDPLQTRLLTCGDLPDSSVSHRANSNKTLIRVNWTAQGEERDIIFRATFTESYRAFWERVKSDPLILTTTTPVHSTTEPTTTTSTEQLTSITMTSSSPTTTPQKNVTNLELPGIILMCFDGFLEEVKMKTSNIFMILIGNRHSYYKRNKILMAVCSMLGVVNSFWSFIFFAITSSYKVPYVALAVVVMGLNFIEWVIALLPLGHCHERNGISDLVVRVCYVPHRICTNALIFLGVIASIDDWGENRKESWLLSVIIADTVWILLTLVWDFGLAVHKRMRQQNHSIENLQHTGYGPQENKKTAFQVTGTAISVMFMVGTTAFSVAVIVGLIQRK